MTSELAEVVAALRAAGCVFAQDEAAVLLSCASSEDSLQAMLSARTSGQPLEHVVGWASFRGLRLTVEPGVFVPRRRTEFLADCAVAAASDIAAEWRAVVVELCCGVGAVAAAVLADRGDSAAVLAADIDPVAVRCAQANVAAAGGSVYCGDLYEPLPRNLRGRVDVLVANAPYVPSEQIALMPPEARDYEPLAALDGGADGLDMQRRVIAEAGAWLAPGGVLLIETSEAQAEATTAAMRAAGLAARTEHSDAVDGTVAVGVAQ